MWRADPLSEQMFPVLLACVVLGLCVAVASLVWERRLLLLRLRSVEARFVGQQEALVRAQFAERRARIARELNDVVAHGISMMTLGVGAGRMIMDKDPERARKTLRVAEESGRQTLVELQRTLSLLDLDGSSAGRTPQPRLSDLRDLFARVDAEGLPVDMVEDGRPIEIGLTLELVAYRIVQEALANTLRHAGARSARVTLRWRPGILDVLVRDDGRADPSATAGHGLLGMRERAALFGGTLAAGTLPGGGFEVRARLPTTGEVGPDVARAAKGDVTDLEPTRPRPRPAGAGQSDSPRPIEKAASRSWRE
ncbi:histidine kinase [Streptosporangium sp. NBC_01810]|uniref:sensor histidine kinase n=1 Tax=Streptosporangium sp. NBC_01810 TaxID=2975951 RepID=UPI002DD9B89C|nr:histidine kinase [Streptosporangium sp. NBC_01810]WSA22975.1 histidine kinase [Streptosporangium sp. NBC_01810]